MKKTRYILPSIIALLCCSFLFWNQGTSAKMKLSDFKLTDIDGWPISIESLKGKTVFLNIWATWCGPCIAEMPSIAKAQTVLGNKVVFLLASEEDTERIRKFEERRKTGLLMVQLTNGADFGFQAIPLTLIFNEQGELKYRELGARDWSTEESIRLIQKP